MIQLHRTTTARGEVAVTLDRATGVVSYRKGGVVQTVVDGKGHNLSPFVTKAVKLLKQSNIRRILVLGHGGGAASSLLHKRARRGVGRLRPLRRGDRTPVLSRTAQPTDGG